MSLVKAMDYEKTPVKPVTKEVSKRVASKAYKNAVTDHNSLYTLGLLVMKHKVALLLVGNIILIMNFVLPEWPQMVLGLLGK